MKNGEVSRIEKYVGDTESWLLEEYCLPGPHWAAAAVIAESVPVGQQPRNINLVFNSQTFNCRCWRGRGWQHADITANTEQWPVARLDTGHVNLNME